MLQMDWVKKHVKFCFHSNPHITSEVSQTDWSNRAFRQWVHKMVRNKIICKQLEQSIIQSITFDPMSHQHVASDAAALVPDALPGRPSPVAYRTSNGKLYWDLSYIFDELQRSGETLTSYKLIKLIEEMVTKEAPVLSAEDFHCRKKFMRPQICNHPPLGCFSKRQQHHHHHHHHHHHWLTYGLN